MPKCHPRGHAGRRIGGYRDFSILFGWNPHKPKNLPDDENFTAIQEFFSSLLGRLYEELVNSRLAV